MPVMGEKGKVRNLRENPTTKKREKRLDRGFWRERKLLHVGERKVALQMNLTNFYLGLLFFTLKFI